MTLPGAHHAYRKVLHHGADIILSPVPRSKIWRGVLESFARNHLRRQVPDEALAKELMPVYPLGSKRILFDNDFYPTLTRANVDLITEPIRSITNSGIVVGDRTIPTDIIICATGFKASEFLMPMSVRGRNGRSLNEDWESGAEAFMGLAIHGYPNLFMIAGPNSFNPAGSNPEMKELQIAYIMECLRWKTEIGANALEVTEKATAEYQEWLKKKMTKTVWQNSVDNWYTHESGKVTNPWPESVRVFAKMLQKKPKHSFAGIEHAT